MNEHDFLNRLLSTSLNGLYIFDFNQGEITFINKQYTVLTGYNLDDIHRLTRKNKFIGFFHPEDRPRVISYMRGMASLKNEEIREIVYRFKRKNGQWAWLISRETVFSRNSDGSIHEYIGSFIDITEQKQAEEKFRDLANSMPQLVWTAKADGVVDYYNEKYKDFLGIEKKDGQFIWSPVLHPEDVDKTVAAWETALKNGVVYEVEHRVKLKKDGYQWFLSRGLPIKDNEGKVIKWYGTATNIHKMKQLEQQKDEFLGIASHELKTPVTSIKAYTQVLQLIFKRQGDSKPVEYLQKMDHQIDRLTTLIGDLLDVTKIQAGKLQLRLENFKLNELIHEVTEELQLTAPKHLIKTKLTGTPTVWGDRARLGQVLNNLLSNAIKYSPDAKTVIVSSKVKSREIVLCVQDFGIGIAEHEKNNIFERFYQVNSRYGGTHPGLGLGLYISNEIVKRHHGEIWVDSLEGAGATFCFRLPLLDANPSKQ